MFGQNALLKQDLKTSGLLIQEIFHTIQGEGPFTGLPAVFVRLAGCNLKCFWCDTDFESRATRHSEGEVMSMINEAKAHTQTDLVILTGGEPLRQNILPLLNVLTKQNHVQIETAGVLWIDGLENYIQGNEVSIVCSPKTGKIHHEVVNFCSHWKYIVSASDCDPKDGLPVMSTQVHNQKQKLYRPNVKGELHDPTDTIWVQPKEEYFAFAEPGQMREVFKPGSENNMRHAAAIAMKYNYRVSLQTHKILNLP